MMVRREIRWRCWIAAVLGLVVLSGCGAGEKVYSRIAPPDWAREDLPARVMPYVGMKGLPDPYPRRTEPIGVGTEGIDFWQANHFIAYRPETAEYLYADYTPTTVDYRKGTFPELERIAAEYTAGVEGDREKAVALLTRAIPALLLHPACPPLGPKCPGNRAMDEEALVRSGSAWCNEQARVFVRLCQVSGIPARLIFLFFADRKQGHVVAEFYADGHWAMADATWYYVVPGPEGRLLSAAECHEPGRNREYVGQAHFKRNQQLSAMSDEELVGRQFADVKDEAERQKLIGKTAAMMREQYLSKSVQELGDWLWTFGVMNHPLPG